MKEDGAEAPPPYLNRGMTGGEKNGKCEEQKKVAIGDRMRCPSVSETIVISSKCHEPGHLTVVPIRSPKADRPDVSNDGPAPVGQFSRVLTTT